MRSTATGDSTFDVSPETGALAGLGFWKTIGRFSFEMDTLFLNRSYKAIRSSYGYIPDYNTTFPAMPPLIPVATTYTVIPGHYGTILTTQEVSAFYFQLALPVRFRVFKFFSFGGGPYFAKHLSGNNDFLKPAEYGVVALARLDFGIFFLEPRYTQGLTNIVQVGTLKTQDMSVLLGLALNVGTTQKSQSKKK